MAIKYEIEYNDVTNVSHRLEIYIDGYTDPVIEIQGTIFLDYSEISDILEPIKGTGLRVDLEANSALTFEDLYSEYEKDIKVIYKRNSVLKFTGWLNPEGWFENWVNDKWIVSFDCIDGISFLENLSYVKSDGLNYRGKETILGIISNCLIRTGLEQDIRTDVDIIYTGLAANNNVLVNAKIDQSRFIKDDYDTIMSCKEVLTSVLEVFSAVIVNMDGYWYIYKPNQLFLNSTLNYYAYNFDGTVHPTATGSINLSFSLGSLENAYYPHHCSGNQSVSNEKSLGGFRVNYKYGIIKGIFENPYLEGDGTLIYDWTINSMSNIIIPGTLGFEITGVDLDTSSILQLTSDTVPLVEDDVVDLRIKFENVIGYPPSIHKNDLFPYVVKIVGGSTLYYSKISDSWITALPDNKIVVGGQNEVTVDISRLVIPIDGDLSVQLWTPYSYLSVDPPPYDPNFTIFVKEVSITGVDDASDIQGEFNTFQRTSNPNSVIKENKEVFNGDNISAIYLGTIYKQNETDLTSTWLRTGVSESKSLLRIMGEDTMRLSANTKKIFSGDVFGYFDYLSRVTINGFSGFFLVTKYSYNTKSNIITAEFKQIFGSELIDIDYQKTYDYGNVVTPTIIG